MKHTPGRFHSDALVLTVPGSPRRPRVLRFYRVKFDQTCLVAELFFHLAEFANLTRLKNPTGTPAFTTGFGPKTVVAQKAKEASLRASLVIGSDCGGGGPISDALRPSFRVRPLVICLFGFLSHSRFWTKTASKRRSTGRIL